MWGEKTVCEDVVKELKSVVENWKANLREANLSGANLSGADLTGAYLFRANLRGAYLRKPFFDETRILTFEQLSEVYTLYQVKSLDPKLEKELREKHPELFEKSELEGFYEEFRLIEKEVRDIIEKGR